MLKYFLVLVLAACTVQPSSEHWLLRVTTSGGAVLNEVQGEGCSVDNYTGRVWVGGGNHYNNATYVITNNAPNVVLSCTKLP